MNSTCSLSHTSTARHAAPVVHAVSADMAVCQGGSGWFWARMPIVSASMVTSVAGATRASAAIAPHSDGLGQMGRVAGAAIEVVPRSSRLRLRFRLLASDLTPVLRVGVFFQSYGVQLWMPEAGGPVDPGNPVHQALMLLLGGQSQREVLRARYRVLAAMRNQAADQGRFLGGRPPYGYRLVDAGPHPNRAHARWGRRLHRLDADPATAPHVRWMFAQRLAVFSHIRMARFRVMGVPVNM